MIPDVSQALAWLEKHPQVLKGIQRGLERETLRVNADGTLATTGHPEALGSALTHKWITTDFAEALLEFITQSMAISSICSPLCAISTGIRPGNWAMSGCGH
nr:gamma-glutamylcysteine synthetase [Salmonella sp. NCTC 7297]